MRKRRFRVEKNESFQNTVPKVSGDSCLKRRFPQRWFKWGRKKTEVFEYNDVIHHLLVLGLRMTLGYSIVCPSFV